MVWCMCSEATLEPLGKAYAFEMQVFNYDFLHNAGHCLCSVCWSWSCLCIGWLLCLHILHTPVQDQPNSPQHAQSLPAACSIQGHVDLSARQGGPCLSLGPFLQFMPADLVFPRQCRDLQDAEASIGGNHPVWHGRQSKDERLADAAESRLLGLAAKPPAAVHSTQQDLELRHHQPISYARRGVQV